MNKFKRIALFAHDGVALTFVACVLCLGFPATAFAYVDPSVMTYAIQALAGVAVALSAVIGVAFRRSRRLLMRLLRIDEDAGKEHDPAVHALTPADTDYAERMARADESAQECKQRLSSEKAAKPLSWVGRFIRALAASAFLIWTVIVMAPVEIVSGSGTSLIFGIGDVLPLILAAAGVATVALALVLSLAKGRAFDVALGVVVAMGLGCYLQALFMNAGLPIADGQSLDLSTHKRMLVISSLVWFALIAGFVVFAVKKPKIERLTIVSVSIALVVVQAAGAVGALADQSGEEASGARTVITQEGLFDLSQKDNVVVFVLDMFDTATMDEVLEDDPDVLDEFTGFTYYHNSSGSMVPTRYGVKYLLTGRVPDGSQDYETFINGWFKDSTLLGDIAEANYDIGIYTDTLGAHNDDAGVFAENIHAEDESSSFDALGALGILTKVALYRDMPWALKPLFWFSTEDVNNAYLAKGDADTTEYAIDDASYAERLRDSGLAINNEEGSFRFIHLMGAHWPYTLDENGRRSGGETDLLRQSEGSLGIVADYLKEMKRLGVYDGATIVITADHGYWGLDAEDLSYASSPIMLVKPAETPEEAAKPLEVSDAPTGHIDYPATLIAAVGGDTGKYGTPVWDVPESEERSRFYWATLSDGKQDVAWQEYVIEGDPLNLEDWRKTDKSIEIPTN